ncbi:MAG: formylglycine-generating enzyme family protein [Aulosira sp. DedQUE10]|nr:formylglycine-generating enzyme family protein [Aulosira sp. DedQUE10]
MTQADIRSTLTGAAGLSQRIRYVRERFGEGHLYFAYHAAFPLALTSDLLYRLWANFQRDIHGEVLNIPWIAVADLLFSALCEEVGHELYEMNKVVRAQLLGELKASPRFGNQRMQELTEFLLNEVQQDLDSSDLDVRDLAQAQRWAALAYTRTGEAAHELALTLAGLSLEDTSEWARMTSLVESFREPLQEAQFEDLLTYIRGMYHFVRDEHDQAAAVFDRLSIHNYQVEIAGVSLPIPKIEKQEQIESLSFLALKVFEFDIVQIRYNSKRYVLNSGWEIIRSRSFAECFVEDMSAGLDLEMVSIPGGEFYMGSPPEEGGETSEHPQRLVVVNSFFMSKYPITQMQWRIVAGLPKVSIDLEPNPSYFVGPHRPVEGISWYDAVEFCERLQQQTGKPYRLPSEAEWEYACRSGTTTPFHFGETINSKLASVSGRYGNGPKGTWKETTVVGYFKVANAFGLYDMHGNVWEWCADQWHESYSQSTGSEFQQPVQDQHRKRVVKGGSWDSSPKKSRSASRIGVQCDYKNQYIGFRVAVSFAAIS